MALCAELLKKFRLEDVPLADKLFAAKALFSRSEFCYISKKEELVLDWLLELVDEGFKNEVWQTIGDCLRSSCTQNIKVVEIKSSTKESFVEVLIRSLEFQLQETHKHNNTSLTANDCKLIRECAILTVETDVFLHYLRKNIEKYIKLSSLILKSATKSVDVDLFIRFVKHLVCFCDQSLKQEEICQVFFEHLFVSIIETYCTLKKNSSIFVSTDSRSINSLVSGDKSVKSENCIIQSEILHLISKLVFPSSVHKSFKASLQQLFENNTADTWILCFLCQFLVECAVSNEEEVIVHIYALVFESCVLTFKNDFNTTYKLLVVFCSLLGYEPTVKKQDDSNRTLVLKSNISKAINEKITSSSHDVSALVLRELIISLKKSNVVLNSTVNKISFKDWMQALISELVTTPSTPYLTYLIIHEVIQLNPLIIEPVVNDILRHVLIQPKQTEDEKEAYKIFFQSLFNMIVKLNRLQNFVCSNLLQSAKQVLDENRLSNKDMPKIKMYDVIPAGIDMMFDNTVAVISGNVSIALLRIFKHSLIQDIVEPIEKGHYDAGHRLFLGVLEHLLVSYLKAVRMPEQSVHQPTCVTFMENLKQLRTCLGRLGVALLQHDHCSTSLASFLRLSLATGEVQLLLLLYSPWSGQQNDLQLIQTSETSDATNLHCLLSFLKPEHWSIVAQRAVTLGDESCQQALNELLLQKLRVLVLFGSRIENSTDMQSKLCEYLMESLKGIQFLQENVGAAVLVPLLPHEKLLSVADNIVEQFSLPSFGDEKFELLKNPVLQENKPLLVALAWTALQKIGGVLAKQKRTYNSETTKLNHRCLLRDIVSSLDFSKILCCKKKKKMTEVFSEIAQKVNEACLRVLQADNSEVGCKPINLSALSKHLILLRNLPLPFLPMWPQTVVAIGIITVITVLNDQQQKNSEDCSGEQIKLKSSKKLCREILQGFLEGPTPIIIWNIVDIGLLVRVLHQDGQCSKHLLQLLFKEWLDTPEHLQNLVKAVCLADDDVEKNFNFYASPISVFLLEMLKKKDLTMMPEDDRAQYKNNFHFLNDAIAKRVELRMKSGKMSDKGVLSLMDAYYSVLVSRKADRVVPYIETFLSCAFSVLETADASEETVQTAQILMEAVLENFRKFGEEVHRNLIWRAYKSSNRPQLVAKLLKAASKDDFDYVLDDLCNSLKLQNDQMKEFPDLRLPQSLVTSSVSMPRVKASRVEQMAVLASSFAFQKIMQGNCEDKLLEFLNFLLAIVLRTKVPVANELADTILATTMCALEVTNMTIEYVTTVCAVVAQILTMMVLHQFPLLQDRIAAFLQAYHLLVHTIVVNSAAGLHQQDQEVEKLVNCALQIEQLSKAMAEHSKDFKAVSQYMVADLLQEFEQTAIHHQVKVHIMNTLYAFLSLCDKYAVAHLSYALPPASVELFKTVSSSYKKFYHYTGKV